MAISIFDLYTIGIGPSSSHVVGPMRAARKFLCHLESSGTLRTVAALKVELYGSLALTGLGHGTDRAILLGLAGETPEAVSPDAIPGRISVIRDAGVITLLGKHPISFHEPGDLVFVTDRRLPAHSNGMRFTVWNGAGEVFDSRTYYSVGGGFVVEEDAAAANMLAGMSAAVPYPFSSSEDLLRVCAEHGRSIDEVVFENEKTLRSEDEIRRRLLRIWDVMQQCVIHGLTQEGVLPGGLNIERRAPQLYRDLITHPERTLRDPLSIMDWVNLYALAVNEENAAGGRVVTAPTNGAAGILPAVLHYYARFTGHPGDEGILRFLLTAGAIAVLYKQNASISGAEVGCQGEVGVACSMAAAGLVSALGGTNEQIENAAEIGMEHNLGLTCDPIGGLVQIPCIERNAMGAIKAVNAARIAMRGDGSHKVSLDQVIATMLQTGADMKSKYKETSQGGLAVNVIEC